MNIRRLNDSTLYRQTKMLDIPSSESQWVSNVERQMLNLHNKPVSEWTSCFMASRWRLFSITQLPAACR
jgi:hypothetical protein